MLPINNQIKKNSQEISITIYNYTLLEYMVGGKISSIYIFNYLSNLFNIKYISSILNF
jgi:hypothetical protein